MPWKPEQRKAIAARMAAQGKSEKEIREFFHEHGHGGEKKPRKLKDRLRKS